MPITKVAGKKNGKQKYRVRVNYTDSFGKAQQIERTAYGLDEAKEIEQELRLKVTERVSGEGLTVSELMEEYLKAKSTETRESTLDKSKRILKYHVIPYLGEYKLKKLTVPVLQKWKMCINEKDLAITTRKNIYAEFRALLNYAVKMEYIATNPLLKIGNFKETLELDSKHEMDFYTADEFKSFIQIAYKCASQAQQDGNYFEWNYYVFFNIAFYTGLRKGEIHALRWCDINNKYLSVTRSITQKLKGEDRITPPKNKSSIRSLQIPKPLMEVLEEHKQRCEKFDNFSENNLICGAEKSLRDTTIQNRAKKFAQLAGVKTIRIHDFRHSHASLLANEGINIQEIARRLGHSNVEMTWNTYSHLYPREEERAVAILNRITLKLE